MHHNKMNSIKALLCIFLWMFAILIFAVSIAGAELKGDDAGIDVSQTEGAKSHIDRAREGIIRRAEDYGDEVRNVEIELKSYKEDSGGRYRMSVLLARWERRSLDGDGPWLRMKGHIETQDNFGHKSETCDFSLDPRGRPTTKPYDRRKNISAAEALQNVLMRDLETNGDEYKFLQVMASSQGQIATKISADGRIQEGTQRLNVTLERRTKGSTKNWVKMKGSFEALLRNNEFEFSGGIYRVLR